MSEIQQYEVWRNDIEPALQSKVDEFHFLGYDRVTGDEVWECVLYRFRKRKEYIHLHEFVNELLTLKAQEYMNWITVSSYREPEDWFEAFENNNKNVGEN